MFPLHSNHALHEIIDRHLVTDLARRFSGALVAHHRAASCDAQVLGIDQAERGGGVFGEAVGQVLTLRIVPEGVERQHCERHGGHIRGAASPDPRRKAKK